MDDRVVTTEESARDAYLRALTAHRRAIARHEAAATVQAAGGKPEAAERERAGAALERERLAAALRRHPTWVEPVRGPRGPSAAEPDTSAPAAR